MEDAQIAAKQFTVEQLVQRLNEDEQPFELIDGEIEPKAPFVVGHSIITTTLFMALSKFGMGKQIGETFIRTSFVVVETENPKLVRRAFYPDLLFVKGERIAAYKSVTPDWEDKPLILVPDLIVEIVSPTDSFSDIDRKVEAYLHDGVQSVWVINPQRQRVNVETVGKLERLSIGDILKGEDIVKGFEMPVAAIFE